MRSSLCILSVLLLGTASASATDIRAQSFDGISISGGGHVVLKYGSSPRITLIKGSTEYTSFKFKRGGSLEIEACNTRCPEHYDLEIEAVTPNIVTAIAVKNGGKIESATGFPGQGEISIAVSGGGEIDVRNIAADQVNAAVNGGGNETVSAKNQLNAAVNGGGEIVYFGDPEVAQAVSSGGNIRRGS